MNKITRLGIRAIRRHPRRALQLSLFVAKHRKAVARVLRATHRAAGFITALKEGATHPKVRGEAKAAGSALARAGREARRAGATSAFRDDQVATHLRNAKRHAANAAGTARRRPPKHGALTRTTVSGSAAAVSLAGALYAGWRRSQSTRAESESVDED